ncbi:MAG: antibiotic biosynthesis monooxygenase [Alphaproteobacteria bacterium]|jgi:quinol monooxygenase YgiN|nr:antibiotic biosynthesis monooxygenase [Alphaproteobacteria bacterium]
MAVTIILEVKAKPGTGDELQASMKTVLPDTRSYDGCISLNTYRDQDDPDVFVLVEHFESKAHYETYLAWRVETGVFAQLGESLAEPPSIRYFDLTDA